jgi:hypothetical protein
MEPAHSLGYPGSKLLERTEEGIISHKSSAPPGTFSGLANYPITIQFSGRAIRKLCHDYDCGTLSIGIFANTKSKKDIPLFCINSLFLSRVRSLSQSLSQIHYSDVGLFKYDPEDESFASNWSLDRSFDFDNADSMKIPKDETVVSFSANYALDALDKWEKRKAHNFAIKFFSSDEFLEKLLLKMDVKDDNSWALEICQRKGVPISKEADSFNWDQIRPQNQPKPQLNEPVEEKVFSPQPVQRVQEKNNIDNLIDADVPEEFICPISLSIMQDPVIAPDSFTYERAEITAWLEKVGTSPKTRLPMSKDQLIFNRALKNQIENFQKQKK